VPAVVHTSLVYKYIQIITHMLHVWYIYLHLGDF
jgi:hypothetical protein